MAVAGGSQSVEYATMVECFDALVSGISLTVANKLFSTVARRGHFQLSNLNLPNMNISKQHHFQNAIFPNLLPRRAQIIVELVKSWKQRKVAGQHNFVDDLL